MGHGVRRGDAVPLRFEEPELEGRREHGTPWVSSPPNRSTALTYPGLVATRGLGALFATYCCTSETMSFDDTLAFVAVTRAGGFTRAGRTLGVPKATLSRRVKRLEERLGVRLLQRTTRKLGLTEAGSAYYERCLHAVEEIEDA